MLNPLNTLTPAELRTELGAAVLTLAEQATTIERLLGVILRHHDITWAHSIDPGAVCGICEDADLWKETK